jgi:uncharacterized protein YkwD
MALTFVDVFLALLVLVGLVSGYKRGFLRATFDLAVLAGSFLFAFLFYGVPVAWLQGRWPVLDAWLPALAFVLLFVVAASVLGTIAYWLLRPIPPKVHFNGFNRFLGLAPGAANGVLHATVALLLLLTVPVLDGFASQARSGVIGANLMAPAMWLESALAPIFEPAVRKVEKALVVPPQSTKRVDLDFRLQDARPRPDLEARMLELVNQERRQHQLPPLKPDPELVVVARAHSQDMLARGYFSHVSPEGESLRERMKRDKVRYLVAGENLALAPDLKVAHEGLMDSPGHRANILRPQFGHVGIGVLDGGRHGLMVTQNYSN